MNEPRELSPHEKARLMLAARIAAGMVANPKVCESIDWQGVIARESMRVADKMLALAYTGGC